MEAQKKRSNKSTQSISINQKEINVINNNKSVTEILKYKLLYLNRKFNQQTVPIHIVPTSSRYIPSHHCHRCTKSYHDEKNKIKNKSFTKSYNRFEYFLIKAA